MRGRPAVADIYSQLQGVASELLSEFSQGTLTLDVYTPGTGPDYNPGPAKYPPTAFKGTVRGTNAKDLKNSLIHAADLIVTMPGSLTPSMKDRITIDGSQYSIVEISAKPAAGTTVAWAVVVRA